MRLRTFALGAAIVWAGIAVAKALVLQSTLYFNQVLPILAGGAVWFLVIVPGAWARLGREAARTTWQ
jgi:hypothetical protein